MPSSAIPSRTRRSPPGRSAAQPGLGRGRGIRRVPVDLIHDWRPSRRAGRPAGEQVRLRPPGSAVRPNYIVKKGKRIEKTPKDGEGRLVSLDPLTCELNREHFPRRRAACTTRRRGARGRLRVLTRSGRPGAVEPGHHDPPLPPLRRQGRDPQLAEGTPALLRYPAARRRCRPQHRRRATRPRRRLHHAEVLRPVHQARRPARRHGHPVPARRAPQERTAPRALPPATADSRCRRACRPGRGHRSGSCWGCTRTCSTATTCRRWSSTM